MRIGILLNETSGPDALDRLTDDIRRAADDGLASAWMPNLFGLDALTALAVAGSRVPGIELGTGVVSSYPRHPGALAQQARTTALAVGANRFTLGLGLAHRIVIENMFGLDFDRPARHMKEYLSVLQPLLAGEPVSYTGETLRANLALTVPNEDPVPVVLAAMAPAMLRLAGRRTDGTVLWMTGAATLREYVVPTITAAAAEAERPAPRIIASLPVLVTDDPDATRALAAKTFAVYDTLPSYKSMMDREGAAGPADLAIIGSEEQVADRIRALFEAGATEFVASVFAGGDEGARTRKVLNGLAG